MRYGEWITETGRVLLRNLYVWIPVVPLLVLAWVNHMLSGLSILGMQVRVMRAVNDPLLQRQLLAARTPGEIVLAGVTAMARMMGIGLPALFLASVLGLLAWLLTFVVEAAVIHQAMPGRTEPPRWQESLHVGVNRAPHLFLIRVVLLLPLLIVFGFLALVFFLMLFVLPASPRPANMGGAMVGVMLFLPCLLAPLLIVWAVFKGMYEPLAVQACVQEVRSAWDAMGRAWTVFWRRLGAVVVLWLIIVAVSLFANGLAMIGSPLSILAEHATGWWALPVMGLWALFALVVTVVSLGIQVFSWGLYARAWPDLASR